MTSEVPDVGDEGVIAVSRTLPNGALDPSFGTGTRFVEAGRFRPDDDETTAALSVVVGADDSVSIVGSGVNDDFGSAESGLFFARLTAAGELHTAVVPGGRQVVAVPGLAAYDIDRYRVGNTVAGPDYVVLAAPGLPTTIVHRSLDRDSGDPDRVVLRRVRS